MQIVIDISENLYKATVNCLDASQIWDLRLAVKDGVPLPKGYGRLIDADDIRVIELEDSLHIIRHEKGDDVDVYIDAPTIIEADRSEEA